MFRTLHPQDQIGEDDVKGGLRALLFDGTCSQVMGVLTGGAFLVAFALHLKASSVVIGLIAAIGPLTQVLQIPAILLVDRFQLRKMVVVVSACLSRTVWFAVALLPWLAPESARVPLLLVGLMLYFGLGTISGCAFNSWMRDFIPEKVMGTFFARRFAIAMSVSAALTIASGFAVDYGERHLANPLIPYTVLFAVGGVSGLAGCFFLSRIPEPRMTLPPGGSFMAALAEPFRDYNFRRLLWFLGSWNFAVNLAAPFFVVYMISRLQVSMALVLGLSVVSQATNVLFFPIWGRLADRHSNKSVLSVSGPLFILSFILWPFTTMPERYMLTVPLLVLIHVMTGMSTAGVTLCAGNIALKSAPKGKATAFLATNALVNGIAATVAPILGGLAAMFFANQEIELALRGRNISTEGIWMQVPAFNLRGLDFLFVLAFLFGMYALHRLIAVREEGEAHEQVVVRQLYLETRRAVRHVSNVAGLRHLTYFPFAILRYAAARNPLRKRDTQRAELFR